MKNRYGTPLAYFGDTFLLPNIERFIVGLIFLRYISSAFERKYNQLVADGDGFEDDKDAYLMDNIFYVPEQARWNTISAAAHTPEIGSVIDDTVRALDG